MGDIPGSQAYEGKDCEWSLSSDHNIGFQATRGYTSPCAGRSPKNPHRRPPSSQPTSNVTFFFSEVDRFTQSRPVIKQVRLLAEIHSKCP